MPTSFLIQIVEPNYIIILISRFIPLFCCFSEPFLLLSGLAVNKVVQCIYSKKLTIYLNAP